MGHNKRFTLSVLLTEMKMFETMVGILGQLVMPVNAAVCEVDCKYYGVFRKGNNKK